MNANSPEMQYTAPSKTHLKRLNRNEGVMLSVMSDMEEEVTLLRGAMTVANEANHSQFAVTRGDFMGADITLAQCGIDKINAAICTQIQVDLYHPDALVFSGTSGELLPNMGVGTVVSGDRFVENSKTLR
jgi:adenosylhomocysteine nucleosidase